MNSICGSFFVDKWAPAHLHVILRAFGLFDLASLLFGLAIVVAVVGDFNWLDVGHDVGLVIWVTWHNLEIAAVA